MKHLQRILLFITAPILLFGTSLASAQAVPADHQSFMVGGWELNEVYHTDGTLMGFWAIPREQLSVGNIRRMWFESQPNGDWEVYAYEPTHALAKAQELQVDGMSSPSMTFFKWREHLASEMFAGEDIDGGVQGLIDKGFIIGDPLVDTAGSLTDPEPLIDLLADVSYPVAPGMTEHLVSGTAGVNVNMNQATKLILDCIRLNRSAMCGECICEVTATADVGEWTIARSVDSSGIIHCDYTRITVHTFWQEGLYPEDCEDCDVGSPAQPETYIQVEEVSVIITGGMTECPPTPDG